MRTAHILALFVLSLSLLPSIADAAPSPGLSVVQAEQVLNGSAHVLSDGARDSGGWAVYGAEPQDAPAAVLAQADGLTLLARPGEARLWQEQAGMTLLVVNAGRSSLSLPASDSRIDIVQEARLPSGEWQVIEHLPQSGCGNSYHDVTLGPGRMWAIAAPRYGGTVAVPLRFRLDLPEQGVVYSNTFTGAVQPSQLRR
jgi:hypothetical protein